MVSPSTWDMGRLSIVQPYVNLVRVRCIVARSDYCNSQQTTILVTAFQPLTTPRYTTKRERRCCMAIEVQMPRLSDTMEEGKILKWLKKVGDKIEVGDIIAEVETDKADMEMEALDAGVLVEIRVPEGETAPVGGVIAVLSEDGTSVA